MATVKSNLPAVGALLDRKLERAVTALGVTLVRDVQHRMHTSPATGRVYRRADGRVHRASAPGEPPAVDSGLLVGSTTVRVYRGTRGPVADCGVVGKASEYAGIEFGLGNVEPRPAWRPALMMLKRRAREIVRQAVR